MKLKPGMLCMIVYKVPMHPQAVLHIGKIVELQKSMPWELDGSTLWKVNPKLSSEDSLEIRWSPSHLKPLKDDVGIDEMIRIAGKPTEIQWLNVCNHP